MMYAGPMTTARLRPAYCEPEGIFFSPLHMPADSGKKHLMRQPSVLNCKSTKRVHIQKNAERM
jgi:hypothetical protein